MFLRVFLISCRIKKLENIQMNLSVTAFGYKIRLARSKLNIIFYCIVEFKIILFLLFVGYEINRIDQKASLVASTHL